MSSELSSDLFISRERLNYAREHLKDNYKLYDSAMHEEAGIVAKEIMKSTPERICKLVENFKKNFGNFGWENCQLTFKEALKKNQNLTFSPRASLSSSSSSSLASSSANTNKSSDNQPDIDQRESSCSKIITKTLDVIKPFAIDFFAMLTVGTVSFFSPGYSAALAEAYLLGRLEF